MEQPISITIDLPSYKYVDVLNPTAEEDTEHDDDAVRQATEARIQEWMDHGEISPFGNLREHVTKVDENVRMAREIRSDAFTVDPSLVDAVENLWAKHFVPSKVKAQPYKINLYAKGGKFKPHRDTPEEDLVGTFILGLGDTTPGVSFSVYVDPANKWDSRNSASHVGSWVAFYPDVPHEVPSLWSGYRAALAFKIFRDTKNPSRDELTDSHVPDHIRSAVEGILADIKLPFGLVLDHRYCFGTTELSGMDALLLSCAKARSDGAKTLLFPVLIQQSIVELFESENNPWDRVTTTTHVKPFTRGVINSLLGKGGDLASWQFTHAPFYELTENALGRWSEEEEEINHTGNESDGRRVDSVYFSYALLCVKPETEVPRTE